MGDPNKQKRYNLTTSKTIQQAMDLLATHQIRSAPAAFETETNDIEYALVIPASELDQLISLLQERITQ